MKQKRELAVNKCRACGAFLEHTLFNAYAFCQRCMSANLISEKSAELDNKRYFNNKPRQHQIDSRRKLFHAFLRIDEGIRRLGITAFNNFIAEIESTILSARHSLEIGFGDGEELIRRLRNGANAYGVDLAENSVKFFKEKYPEFAKRVRAGNATSFGIKTDAIYSNALFEHLDKPDVFLRQARQSLKTDGILIFRIPLLVNTNISLCQKDISFWNPCHRILYTQKGLEIILARNGFRIVRSATLNYYGYRVMNEIYGDGYTEIMDIRNPYFEIRGLNSNIEYAAILFKSLFRKLACVDFAFAAKLD